MKGKNDYFCHTIQNKSLEFIDKSLSCFSAFVLVNKLKENEGLLKYSITISVSVNGKLIQKINQSRSKEGNLIFPQSKSFFNEEENKKIVHMLDNLYENSKINICFLEEIIKITLKDKLLEIILKDMCLNNNKSLLIEDFKKNKFKNRTNDSYIKTEFSNNGMYNLILKVVGENKTISEELLKLIKKEDQYKILNLIDIKLMEQKNKKLLLEMFEKLKIDKMVMDSSIIYNKEIFDKYMELLLNEEIKYNLNLNTIRNLTYRLSGKNEVNLKKIFEKKYSPKKIVKLCKSELKNEEYKNIGFLLSITNKLNNEVMYLREIINLTNSYFNLEKINNRLININIKEIFYIIDYCKAKKVKLYLSLENLRKILNDDIDLDIKKEIVDLIDVMNSKELIEVKIIIEQYELKENLKYF